MMTLTMFQVSDIVPHYGVNTMFSVRDCQFSSTYHIVAILFSHHVDMSTMSQVRDYALLSLLVRMKTGFQLAGFLTVR